MGIQNFTGRHEATDRGISEKSERAMFCDRYGLLKKAINHLDRYIP